MQVLLCFLSFFFNQKLYCKNWEGGEAYEIPRLPDGGSSEEKLFGGGEGVGDAQLI